MCTALIIVRGLRLKWHYMSKMLIALSPSYQQSWASQNSLRAYPRRKKGVLFTVKSFIDVDASQRLLSFVCEEVPTFLIVVIAVVSNFCEELKWLWRGSLQKLLINTNVLMEHLKIR